MEKVVLKSTTDFVLELEQKLNAYYFKKDKAFSLTVNYAKFLKQPLTLGMFVACDLDGNVIPEKENHFIRKELEEYPEAEKRVLFEGFEVIKWDHGGDSYSIRKNNGTKEEIQVCYYKAVPDYFVWSFETVEQLTAKNLVLTESAKKKIGL